MTKTKEVKYRVFAKDADAAAAKAVDLAGRDGHDVYDLRFARRAPKGQTELHFADNEFHRHSEFIVAVRVIVR